MYFVVQVWYNEDDECIPCDTLDDVYDMIEDRVALGATHFCIEVQG